MDAFLKESVQELRTYVKTPGGFLGKIYEASPLITAGCLLEESLHTKPIKQYFLKFDDLMGSEQQVAENRCRKF